MTELQNQLQTILTEEKQEGVSRNNEIGQCSQN